MSMVCEGTSFAFQGVAVIPEVGRLYALSIAPITNSVRLLVLKCKRDSLPEHALL